MPVAVLQRQISNIKPMMITKSDDLTLLIIILLNDYNSTDLLS